MVFTMMDRDKSGGLDVEEFKAFLYGRYNIHFDDADILFKIKDKDSNNIIDIEEFTAIGTFCSLNHSFACSFFLVFNSLVNQMNFIAMKFDEEDSQLLSNYHSEISNWKAFGSLFCICTLGSHFFTHSLVVTQSLTHNV